MTTIIRSCKHCGNSFRAMKHNQRYCSDDCKRKAWNTKPDRRTPKPEQVMTFDALSDDHSGCKIVEAPDEYVDYIGLVYNGIELKASLEMGALPPGVIVQRGGKRLKVAGTPTPLDICLKGHGPYNHQYLTTIK